MDELFIILPVVAIVSIGLIIYFTRTAHEVKEQPKEIHQVRKMTFVVSETEKPKRKKKKYYNKKKKPVVAESAPTEKRPVGRPRKTAE